MPDKIVAHIDGASRGNPGPAAAGFILTDSAGSHLQAKALFIGRATNNVAEYTALVKALEAAKRIGAEQLTVFSDSELLVRQINGRYKVKSEQIRPLFRQAVDLLGEFENWKVRHIPREKNKEADELVNQALNLERDVVVKREDRRQRTEDKRQSPECERGVKKKDEHQASLVRRSFSEGGSIEHRTKAIRLGVLISGGGTTLMNLLEYINEGRLNAEVAVVISSRSAVAGVERAKNAGLDVKIIRKKDYGDIDESRSSEGLDEFSKRIEEELVAANVDLVVQGGWLCLWKIPARYENRVMNIHPALLPSFGGKGMWGHHVHEAVLKAGCKVSGCTVHFCTNQYDKGPIIVQRACEVKDTDSPETLAARVFEQECIAYPQAIKLFAENKLPVQNDKAKRINRRDR